MVTNIYGEGPTTLILIHGGPSLYGYMGSLAELIKGPKLTIIDYAQRGTFENPSSGANLSLQLHIKDIEELIIKYSNESSVILLGHSWGANLALLAASQLSELIKKTVVIGTAPFTDELGEQFGHKINSRLSADSRELMAKLLTEMADVSSDEDKNALARQRLKIVGPAYHFDPNTEDSVPLCQWNFVTFQASIKSLWDMIDKGDVAMTLSHVKSPVTAFHGCADPIPADETLAFLGNHISDLKQIKVAESGHFPWLELTSQLEFIRLLKAELDQ